MLQPTYLASIEVGLDEDVHQRFMISVDVTHIATQVMPPLHTPKIYTHELSVNYMIPSLSGGEAFTVEHHRTTML